MIGIKVFLSNRLHQQYSYLRGFIIRTWVLADNYLIMCHVSVQRWSTRQRYTYITVINDMTAVWAIPAPCFCNQFLYLVMPLQVVSHGLQQKEHIGAGSQVNVKENLKTVKLNRIFFILPFCSVCQHSLIIYVSEMIYEISTKQSILGVLTLDCSLADYQRYHRQSGQESKLLMDKNMTWKE